MFDNYKVIFWDFDGVIINSNSIRDIGFEKVLSNYPKDKVLQLLNYHRENGGLSRYTKFRYFFENILFEPFSSEKINLLAKEFSTIMLCLLIDSNLLIDETLDFIELNGSKFEMHITSGSDQNELRFLCKHFGIDSNFKSILGSPTDKKTNIGTIIKLNNYRRDECLLIGDSINDYHAAIENGIDFFGYNNINLFSLGNYILDFKS